MCPADVGRAFGTVITVGASVVALDMVSRLGKTTRKDKNNTLHPTFTRKSYVPKHFDIKPIKWKL